MRRLLTVVTVVTVLSASADAQLQVTSAPSALMGAWAMSTPADVSGNNRTATFTNMTTVPGKFNEGQAFNGNTSRMTVPTFSVGGAFTIEAWVKVTQVTRSVIGAPREGPAWWQAIVYKGKDDFYIAESGGFYTAGFTNTAGVMTQLVSPTTYPPNVMRHVAATYNGATFQLYVDGIVVASKAVTGAVFGTMQPVEVGGSAVDQGYLSGVIDDVRIYNRGLSAAEINTDLATPVDTTREEVVSWQLDVFAPARTSGSLVASQTFLKSNALCNLAPQAPPTETVTNPTRARVSDPQAMGRECEFVIEPFILSLPVTSGYTTVAKAKGATTTSDPSPPSNPFDRVAVVTPPLAPGTAIVK